MKADLMAIGKITKPHGVQGGLRVVPLFDLKELLVHFGRLWLVRAEQVESFAVESARQAGRFLILKLREVDDVQTAERYRGWEVAVPRDRLPPLPTGQYYSFQLVGLSVVTEGDEVVGTISEVVPMPAHDVYRVRSQKGEVLIPAVKQIVTEIDLDQGRVVIRSLEGLLEPREGLG